MLHKTLGESIKDVDTLQGIITGYAAAFNIIDDDQDIILPGSFTKTLAEQGPLSKQPRIKFLYQHDQTKLLGVPSVLREDGYGLYFEAKLADTQLARDTLVLYSEKILTEHSIGYEVVESSWDRIQAARLLKQLRLYEFSAVTWGAQSQTPVISIKSMTDPARLTAMADRAARLDSILHSGNLRSDALCQTLDRELKALHAALAPADALSHPYTIQGVTATMTQLAQRLGRKAATDDDKAAQEARAKKYGIGIKDGGAVTKPSAQSDVPDSEWGDPVNYRYPMKDKSHADDAAARFAAPSAREQYTAKEQDIIAKRIMARQKDFDESPDWWPLQDGDKGATMNKRQVKGSGGSVEVAADGTHAAYTGTHTHGHKAMGSQGGDESHDHTHTHEGDAKHDHTHEEKGRPSPRFRKAMDFATALTIVSADDTLQDEWGDAFQALVNALESVMVSAHYQTYMVTTSADETFDGQAAAETVLSQFTDAMTDLVQRSLAADFVPSLDDDGDSFYDPDGPNAVDDDDCDYGDYKSRRHPQRMPNAPAPLRKAGRAISSPNRQVITDALDGMSEAMKSMKEHHAAIADLMTKTDPDATRQDEDDTQGDDDTENGGTNINHSKSRNPAPDRRKAGTTHQTHSTIFADFDAITSRIGRKAP